MVKYHVLNDIVLFGCGRVSVVRCLADKRCRFQLYWNVQDAKVLERSTPARSLSLFVGCVLGTGAEDTSTCRGCCGGLLLRAAGKVPPKPET